MLLEQLSPPPSKDRILYIKETFDNFLYKNYGFSSVTVSSVTPRLVRYSKKANSYVVRYDIKGYLNEFFEFNMSIKSLGLRRRIFDVNLEIGTKLIRSGDTTEENINKLIKLYSFIKEFGKIAESNETKIPNYDAYTAHGNIRFYKENNKQFKDFIQIVGLDKDVTIDEFIWFFAHKVHNSLSLFGEYDHKVLEDFYSEHNNINRHAGLTITTRENSAPDGLARHKITQLSNNVFMMGDILKFRCPFTLKKYQAYRANSLSHSYLDESDKLQIKQDYKTTLIYNTVRTYTSGDDSTKATLKDSGICAGCSKELHCIDNYSDYGEIPLLV